MLVSWFVRYGHVLCAAIWAGGYALVAFVIVPMIGKGANETLVRLAITTMRVLSYAGTFTMLFGLILIAQTNGFAHLFGTMWGSLIITGFVIAVALLGIGDGVLRPAIRKRARTGDASAQLWAIIGFALTVLAIGIMTASSYVS